MRIATLLIMLALPASAETWQGREHGSTVTLRPTDVPGADHELLFDNRWDDGAMRFVYTSRLGPHGIRVTLGAGDADTLAVDPGEGFVAVPPEVIVRDGAMGVVVIYSLDGVGM